MREETVGREGRDFASGLGGGIGVGVVTHEYDDRGNRVRSEFDWKDDGRTDVVNSWTYENGDKVLWEHDNDADGEPDFITTLTYDCG